MASFVLLPELMRVVKQVMIGAVLAAGLSACKVACTDTGKLPEVDVTVKEEGRMPQAEVEPAEVEVRTERREVEVPRVDVRETERAER